MDAAGKDLVGSLADVGHVGEDDALGGAGGVGGKGEERPQREGAAGGAATMGGIHAGTGSEAHRLDTGPVGRRRQT